MSDLGCGCTSQFGAGNSATDLARLFGQVTLLPLTTFVYSLELFAQALRSVQNVTDRTISATAANSPQSSGSGLGVISSLNNNIGARGGYCTTAACSGGRTQSTIGEEERKMSDQSRSQGQDTGSWSSSGGSEYSRESGGRDRDSGSRDYGSRGGDDWTISQACRDKDPCDLLRLVRFKVLFLKRNLEVAFPENEELVSEDMTRDGFISWKIAEFIQAMSREEIEQPKKWRDKDQNDYPKNAGGDVVEKDGKFYVTALPDNDKRYLRVYSQVLDVYDREKRNYDRDQADVLRDIRDHLRGGTITVKNV